MLDALERRWPLVGKTINEWLEDNVPSLGAALAYYTALSIAPLLVIALGIAALFLGEEAARGGVMQQMQSLIGEQGAKAIEDMIASANKPSTGVLATVLSVVVLLFGASGVFGQLQHSLNTIWEVEPKPGLGMIWPSSAGFTQSGSIGFSPSVGPDAAQKHSGGLASVSASWAMRRVMTAASLSVTFSKWSTIEKSTFFGRKFQNIR